MNIYLRNVLLSIAESFVTVLLVVAPVTAYVLAGRNAGRDLTYHQAGSLAVLGVAILWLMVSAYFTKRGGWELRTEGTGLALYVSLDHEVVLSISMLVIHLRVRYTKP